MKVPSSISVTSHVHFPVEVIEEFVNARLEHKAELHVYQPLSTAPELQDFEHIFCCSSHITVTGTVEMALTSKKKARRRVSVDVGARYFFTCIRTAENQYKMAWSVSLN